MKITEGQLRRIIRQEVRQLTEASGFKFPADYPKEWRASRRDFPGDWDIAAEQAVGAGVPMQFTPAYKEMTRTTRGFQAYHKKIDAHLLRVQRKAAGGAAAELNRKAAGATAAEPARAPRKGKAPTVTGGRPKVRAAAQEALEMYYADYDPEQIVETMVEMTAKYEPGYRPSGELGDFNDRMKIIGDQASEAVALIARVDPEAAEVLEAALGEFDGF